VDQTDNKKARKRKLAGLIGDRLAALVKRPQVANRR